MKPTNKERKRSRSAQGMHLGGMTEEEKEGTNRKETEARQNKRPDKRPWNTRTAEYKEKKNRKEKEAYDALTDEERAAINTERRSKYDSITEKQKEDRSRKRREKYQADKDAKKAQAMTAKEKEMKDKLEQLRLQQVGRIYTVDEDATESSTCGAAAGVPPTTPAGPMRHQAMTPLQSVRLKREESARKLRVLEEESEEAEDDMEKYADKVVDQAENDMQRKTAQREALSKAADEVAKAADEVAKAADEVAKAIDKENESSEVLSSALRDAMLIKKQRATAKKKRAEEEKANLAVSILSQFLFFFQTLTI